MAECAAMCCTDVPDICLKAGDGKLLLSPVQSLTSCGGIPGW